MSDQTPEQPARLDLDLPPLPDDPSERRLPVGGVGRFADPPATAGTSAAKDLPTPGYGGGYYDSGAETHVLDYLRVLHKRRWIALTLFLLVFGSAVLYSFTATPVFEARTQLLIENENPNVVKFEEVFEQNKLSNDYYQTQYRILQSRLIAKRVVIADNLVKDPRFIGDPNKRTISLNPVAWALSVYAFAKNLFVEAPAGELPDKMETTAQSRAIDTFLGGLTISPVRNSRLVDIRYRSTDPALAAQMANGVAREYISQNLEFRFMATKEATEFLQQRMAEQRKSLEQSETAVQKYRESTDSVSLEDKQNIVVQRLADLNAAVTRARTDRIQREGAWTQIRAIQNDKATLEAHPLILASSFVQQLKAELQTLQQQQAQLGEKLGDRHPEMLRLRSAISNVDAKLQTETAKVVQAVKNEYEAAQAQERSLLVALDQQKNEALALNRNSVQYGVLRRDAVSNQQLYEGLLQRAKETSIEGELKTSNIRVVDQAEPPRKPSEPDKVNNIVFGFFGGLFFGVAVAFLFEYLDGRIKSPEEIREHLGLPFLGLVPALTEKERTSTVLLNSGVPTQFTEAFRTIRTNVLFSSADGGSRAIVITSTAPGEGKTLVSTNLAMSLALAGQRVLIIDADMRRPKVHEVFDLPQEPGLSNVMVGDAKASDAVKPTGTPNLWALAAGKHPPNPAELLGSQRFKRFLESLGSHFDWVILDSPPVMAVTDSAVVSHLASGVLFVVGAEMTNRGAAKAALDQLDSAKAKYLGVVLNRVDLHGNSYYYAHYYKRSYSRYYQTVSAD